MTSKSTQRKRKQAARKALRGLLRSPEHEASWSGEIAFEGDTKLVCQFSAGQRFKLRVDNTQLPHLIATLAESMPTMAVATTAEMRLRLLRVAITLAWMP